MEKEIQKKQIEDMYNVVRDVLKNWWVILFIAISVSLLTYIGAAWMYPEEESVRESEDGYISGDGEDCCCTGDESSDGVCDERFPGDIVQAS